MDPPKHDRIKQLFLAGFTNEQIARHEDWIREIVVTVLDRLDAEETCDLVGDVCQPVVARLIHRLLGIPEEDVKWANYLKRYMGRDDPDLNPGEPHRRPDQRPRARRDRRADALGRGDHVRHALLIGAGNDSTMATYVSTMKALMENPAVGDGLRSAST